VSPITKLALQSFATNTLMTLDGVLLFHIESAYMAGEYLSEADFDYSEGNPLCCWLSGQAGYAMLMQHAENVESTMQ